MKKKNVKDLLAWYSKNKRDLPWRHTKDSYKIWISETMLQQTRVETVIPYYERFLKNLPTVSSLAKIHEDELLKLWEGLGYYSRARNLQKAAKILYENGFDFLPPIKEVLQSLPGIGPYTVGAVLSIAYDISEPAIDGNVMRVLSRIYEEKEDILKPKIREKYRLILQDLMKDEKASDFTQSFIELGALVCTRNPSCEVCPLKSCCKAYQHQTISLYPMKKVKKEKPIFKKTAFIFTYKNVYMIHKRDNEGLLANLYEIPNVDSFLTIDEAQEYLQAQHIIYESIQEIGEVKHIFSHQIWTIKVYFVSLQEKIRHELFVSSKEIQEKYSLPTVFQKVWNLQKEKNQKLF